MSFNHKVLQFQNSNNQNGVTSKEPVIGHDINKNKNIQKAEKFSKKNIILLSIAGLILIIVIIVFIALFANITEPQKCCDEPSDIAIINQENSTSNNEDLGPLEMQTEYKIKSNVGDLKNIYVNQRYYEVIKVDGILTQNIVDRKTNYIIYFIKEILANDEEIEFYNKTYIIAVSISSECVSNQDEYCLPKKLVDLNNQDYSHVRNLEEIDDLENIPLPLCLVNITDNNVIKSISCHKKLPESKVNSIVLDLYFFRPPGIKRPEKEKGNITITSHNEGNNQIIRETNGGLCEVENTLSSFCTTDMNTTKDSEGNLLAYDELAFTNITTDENNYFIKNKYTKLLDKTIPEELNPDKFNETLNILYPKLKDYMKYYEHFNLTNFKELYKVSKGIANETKVRRNLYYEKPTIINEENLFKFTHFGGIQILINLKDNIGYNSQSMEADNYVQIDDKIVELGKLTQFSDIDKVISKLISLSRAGNNLATILYQKIKENLNNITDIITINIPNINKLLVYKDLSEIFDSAVSLKSLKHIPIHTVEESNTLINKLDQVFNGIENGSLKKNIRVLNDYLYQFIKQSHILVNNLSNNLKELGNLIQSPKQAIASISAYYMNNTSTSYINVIQEAEKILMNYYIDEKDLIIPEVEKILSQFEEITIESLQKQLKIVNNLNSKIEDGNLTIIDADEEDYRKIIVNLDNSNNYISKIIDLFKKKVRNEMDLKNGYFISKYDIESNNETFNRIIEESLIIAQNLDNNEYIDKTFDNIMMEFRKGFVNIIKDMDEKKEEQFPMDENTLKGEFFRPSEVKKISKELKDLSVDIFNKIRNENNEYLNLVKEKVDAFLNNNKQFLINLKQDIETIFSEEKIEYLANVYDNSFNGYLNSITNLINTNKNIANTYFNGMERVATNNKAIVDLLVNYPVDKSLPPGHPCVDPNHCWQYTRYEDLIYNRYITHGYLNKYNIYKAKFENAKDYINEELNSHILEEYKNIISKIKGVLQSFRNNKVSDKYPEYTELDFIDSHITDIEKLYNRLNKYISDDKFNTVYLNKIRNYKISETNEINNIKNYIETKHAKITTATPAQNDFQNDICTTFKRRKTYTCTNSAVYTYDEDTKSKCLSSWGGEDYKKLTIPSFIPNANLQKEFNSFFNLIKSKIDTYNSKIDELKLTISSIENQILNKNIALNYLTPIQSKINAILSEKFSGNLIRASYNYYKNLIDERLEDVLNSASNKWIYSFDLLSNNVNKSLNEFKNSMNEFGIMALIYEAVISQNLTKIYYDSIIKHQKSEYNYTISYYYNFLLQNVTAVYQYIVNQIPTNQQGFNNSLNMRKKEVIDIFNKFLKNISNSKSDALSLNNQLYFLQVPSSNFFDSNSILAKINNELSTILKYKGTLLYRTKNGKQNDEYSLSTRFYLENSLNGWQIDELYKPINEDIFVYLNLEKFKELLSNNWIFDQDDFINRLNLSLYNSNLEIKNSFLNGEREKYYKLLEDKITLFYTKESIQSKIAEQFKTQIKEIDLNLKNSIKQNIQEILDKIKTILTNEIERLKTTATSLTNDFSKINQTIENYKNKIINYLKTDILNKIVNDFYQNMINKIYINRFETGLNEYLNKAYTFSLTCITYETLRSSYNIGEISYNIVKELVTEYKNTAKKSIDNKRDEYIAKLSQEAGIEELKQLINNEIDPKYSDLLKVLKDKAKNNPGDAGYSEYDLSNQIKTNLNSTIDEKMKIINNNVAKIKGDKFDVDYYGWDIFDYDDIPEFDQINTNFEVFIKKKINNEKNSINAFLQEIIKNNFNILIDNLILTFGAEFFDRVIKYNENFKITSLYQNLKYSLVVSLQYYSTLNGLKKNVDSLTKDLKIKLYNLNNLDLIAKEKNQKVLNLLSQKADDFIEESMYQIIKDYKTFLKEDISIQNSFNNKILESISINLEVITSQLEKDYKYLLNENFKKKLINSYSKVMDEQTKDMIETVENLKQQVKSIFDDLFSIDIDKVLNETNYKMNVTLDSINEYNNYFNSFKIPEEFIKFLNSYGKSTIEPTYKGLENLLNKETKNLTIQFLDKNSEEYEKIYNTDKFYEEMNKTYKSIKEENIDIILNEIQSYGSTENEYKDNLQNEIDKIERRNLRRLNGEGTEEDISEEYKEKVADKSIDENFHKLLNSSENTISFINSFEYFYKFEENLEKYLTKLNISYKESQETIDTVYKEEEETYELLTERLQTLNNISLNYYLEIKESFYSLRKYIEDNLKEIYNSLNLCANSTYKIFATKYEEISNSSEAIDAQQDKIEEEINNIKKTSISQNTEYNTEAKIKSLFMKARFIFSLLTEEEGNIKKPKVKASVINQIRPKSIVFEISNSFGTCGKNIQKVEVQFNNVSYITDLNFDTKSTLINVTTKTDFDSYKYYISKYKIDNSDDNVCNSFLGINICFEEECDTQNPILIEAPILKTQKELAKEEIISIEG